VFESFWVNHPIHNSNTVRNSKGRVDLIAALDHDVGEQTLDQALPLLGRAVSSRSRMCEPSAASSSSVGSE
jgi:hypothetical protein